MDFQPTNNNRYRRAQILQLIFKGQILKALFDLPFKSRKKSALFYNNLLDFIYTS